MKKILLIKVMNDMEDAVFETGRYYSCIKPSEQNVSTVYIIGESNILGVPLLGYCEDFTIKPLGLLESVRPEFNAEGRGWKYEWELKNLARINHVFDFAPYLSQLNNEKDMEKYIDNVQVLGYLEEDSIATEILVKTNVIKTFNDLYMVGDTIPCVKKKVGAKRVTFKDVQVVRVENKLHPETDIIREQLVWVNLPIGQSGEMEEVQYSAKFLRDLEKEN